MQRLSRRQFAQFGAASVALAFAVRGHEAAATGGAGSSGASAAAVPDPLAPIAPELRPAAQRMLALGLPRISAATLRNAPPDANAPRFELLPEVAVTRHAVPAQGRLPAVSVFAINGDASKQRPAILHMHGGGFVLGSAASLVRPLQETALSLDCVVVTVEYRLAPETRYSGSTEDTYAALNWLYTHAEELGVDRARIAVMGESAGGGHAALLAIKARDRGEIPLVLQSLVYPMLDDRTGSADPVPPHIATVGWSAEENRLGWRSFLGVEPGTADVPAQAVPARLADFGGLAPAWIGVGGVDLFAAEDIDYARKLTLANVPTELLVIPGGFHGFDVVAPESAPVRRFAKAKLNALRRAFGRPVVD